MFKENISLLESRIATIQGLLKNKISKEELQQIMVKSFCDVFDFVDLQEGAMTPCEKEQMIFLRENKYVTQGWNFYRNKESVNV